jgi:hypothetical protein
METVEHVDGHAGVAMSIAGLNKRIGRLKSAGNLRHVIGERLDRAKVELCARHDELRGFGLSDAEIAAKESAEMRDWLARTHPVTPLEKRIWKAKAILADWVPRQ